ncbi:MAG: hypothetical protein P8N02_04415, partial [Actinomycetota bacterium]|nr:hypothetical protein [Actinomycetota bacterium]
MRGSRVVWVSVCLFATALALPATSVAGADTGDPVVLSPDDAAAGDEFGRKLAVDGDTVVVSSTRSAYVFVRRGDEWRQQAQLVPESPVAADSCFGQGVAIDGA